MSKARMVAPVAVVVAAVALWLALRARGGDADAIAASGTVEATQADLGFQAGGRIADVLVREGERVEAGQLLARLDAAQLQARRAAAEAQVAGAQALLAELERGARPEERAQAEAAAGAAAQQAEEAGRAYERTRALFEGGAVSREALDRAETALAAARAQAEQTGDQLRLVRQGARAERLAAQRAAVRGAEAQLEEVRAVLAQATILAPFAGIVTVRHREPGETVAPGLPVVTLLDPANRWVRIYVREDRIGRISIGQAALVSSDSHPGKSYEGRVTYIAGEAEFTPRNVQTAEERVKLVYAVNVTITADPELELKPGVPADVVLSGER